MFKRLVLPLLLLAVSASFSAQITAGETTNTTNTTNTNYQQALDEMNAKSAKSPKSAQPSPLTDADRAAMKAFKQSLATSMKSPGIKVGQQAPDFSLKNAFGATVTLSEELKKGPVVLVFYRGAWCPYCNIHLHVLKNAQPQFDQYNAQIIAVSPQMAKRSKEAATDHDFVRYVLSDSSSQVMKDYQLYFKVPPNMVEVYKKFNLDLEHYNGIGRNVLPVPGSFVIDQSGKVVAMQAQTDYKLRMEPAAILAALKAL